MQDIREAKSVELIVDDMGKVWINIDNECVIRVRRAEGVYIDNRYGYAHEEDGQPVASLPPDPK